MLLLSSAGFVFFNYLFLLMLYVPVNNFSVMLGQFPYLLGWTSSKQQIIIKWLAQGQSTRDSRCKSGISKCLSLNHNSLLFFKKKFWQEHSQSVKQFGSRSGPTTCLGQTVHKGYQQTTSKEKVSQYRAKYLIMQIESKIVNISVG